MKRRRFDIYTHIGEDAKSLAFIEYEWDEHEPGEVTARVLTEEGWKEFKPYEMLPGPLPKITGRDMVLAERVDKKLAEFEAKINNWLHDIESPAEPPAIPLKADRYGR